MNSKLFYSINEVSEYTGVPPYTIRYWEKNYNLIRPEKDSRGRRRYKYADLELLKKIKELIYDKKYKPEGVKKKIKEGNREESSGAMKETLNLIKKELESILEIVNR
jgi:DNA-binding transcriptional MerR regulator